MKQSLKRLTALVLALSMALSLLCGSAWAADAVPADESAEPVAEVLTEDTNNTGDMGGTAEISADTEHFPAPEGAAVAEAHDDAPLVRAGETATVHMEMTYCQTKARSILSMVNALRTGSDAWYWNSDDTTKTVCSNLSNLSYDYDLEKVAMQRAAEIALSFSHTRTNGQSCWTAYNDAGYAYGAAGENIAAGYTSAQSVFEGWSEEDKTYSGQGHRRNMLSADTTAIGIACVYYNGYYYWVQEFAAPKAANTQETEANDAKTKVNVEILLSDANVSAAADPSSLVVACGKSVNLPALNTAIQMSNAWPAKASEVTVDYTWSIADSECATLSGNMVTGVKEGSATLVASVLGKTVSVPLTVGADISEFTVSLSAASCTYNGAAQTPAITVKDGSATLTEGTDYTVAYSNNTNAGTATITITGIGKYSGTVTKNFTINKAANSITAFNVIKNASTKAQTFSLNAKATGGTLTYESSDNDIEVDGVGTVTIPENYCGTATITITAGDSNYETVNKTVTVEVNQIDYTIIASNITKTYSAKKQTFSIDAECMGDGKMTYSSDNKSVTVSSDGEVTVKAKFIGKASITIKAAASDTYEAASKKITVTVRPTKTTLSSVANVQGKKMTVKWKKNTVGTGYQIQYSTSKTFAKGNKTVNVSKKATTSKTISGLTKGKTYYARIRTYKTVSGEKIYSAWSTVKKVTIKK